MKENIKSSMELDDDQLGTVSGGLSMDTILSMGQKVTATKVTCPLCGTSRGALGSLYGLHGIVCCGAKHEALYAQNQFSMDAILVMNPTKEDYTPGW